MGISMKMKRYFQINGLENMQEKFEVNLTKTMGGCQSERKVVTHNSKSNLPLVPIMIYFLDSEFCLSD